MLSVIALRAVVRTSAAGARHVDASGVLVFVVAFALAFVVAAARGIAWGQLLAFGCAIASSGVWRALRE